jgi:hypothetical protein
LVVMSPHPVNQYTLNTHTSFNYIFN